MLAMMGGMLALQQLSQLEREETERRLREMRRISDRISQQREMTRNTESNDSDDIFPSDWSYARRIEAVKAASREWYESQQSDVSHARSAYY